MVSPLSAPNLTLGDGVWGSSIWEGWLQ